jgi:hypothetical protein
MDVRIGRNTGCLVPRQMAPTKLHDGLGLAPSCATSCRWELTRQMSNDIPAPRTGTGSVARIILHIWMSCTVCREVGCRPPGRWTNNGRRPNPFLSIPWKVVEHMGPAVSRGIHVTPESGAL